MKNELCPHVDGDPSVFIREIMQNPDRVEWGGNPQCRFWGKYPEHEHYVFLSNTIDGMESDDSQVKIGWMGTEWAGRREMNPDDCNFYPSSAKGPCKTKAVFNEPMRKAYRRMYGEPTASTKSMVRKHLEICGGKTQCVYILVSNKKDKNKDINKADRVGIIDLCRRYKSKLKILIESTGEELHW
jgi:hypothetical protein